MQQLFKSYLPTVNKVPTVKFTEALPLSKVSHMSEYAAILGDNTILIDIDDYEQSEILMNIVEDLQLNCRVYATTRGKHFMFYGGKHDKCGTHLKLAIGIEADIKIGSHNSISVLKYNNKVRDIIYDISEDEEYEEAPDWLLPVKFLIFAREIPPFPGKNFGFYPLRRGRKNVRRKKFSLA